MLVPIKTEAMTDKNPIEPGEEEFDKDASFELPKELRKKISWPTGILVFLILTLYFYLILCQPSLINPSEYGLPEILLAAVILLTFINIPWNKLGFRIKKIGVIELEQVIKGQAQSNSSEFADLQRQIDELKKWHQGIEYKKSTENDLDELVVKFLKRYGQWAFSALRIQTWGGSREEFQRFQNYKTEDIRESLRRLHSKGLVVTRISKKGNTIYKFK